MKVLKKIKRFASSQSRSGHNSTGSLNSCPINFHSVHGENIGLSRDGAVARRTDSFCKGIAFTNRPVKVNERVYLKFVETSTSWSGALRFGFTSVDPANSRSALPKYACPDLTNKPGYWAKALGERQAPRDSILFYYVNETGHVHYGINGEEKGIFFDGVNTSGPLWGMIDVYGNTVAVELIIPSNSQPNNIRLSLCDNSSRQMLTNHGLLNNHRNPTTVYPTSPEPVTNEPDANRLSLRLSSLNLDQLDNIQAQNSIPVKVYKNAQFSSMPFHRTKGSNVFLSNSNIIAERSDSHYCQGYVFTSRPLRLEERFVIQILKTERSYVGALTFGMTSCDPSSLNVNQQELPDDPDMLLDRPEYWVLRKDVAESPQKGDELAFVLRNTGEVQFAKNNLPLKTIMHVDQTQQLYAFFDLYGNTLKIKSLGITSSDCSISTIHRLQRSQTLDPSSTSFLDSSASSAVDASNNGSDNVMGSNECTLCFERIINCVLYDCGHMCMCYQCAQIQWKNPRGGFCPICRKAIRDVVRIYRT